ncbi:MAG: penicillin-binding protein 2 [Candidatus Omnitrophota bacterium]
MRVRGINLTVIGIFLLLSFGIFKLQVINREKFTQLSDKNCIRLISQEGARGKIIDRKGDLIVGSKLTYDLMLLPQDKIQIDNTLKRLSELIPINFKDLKNTFRRNYIAPFIPVVILKNIDMQKAIMLGELKADYNNIIIQPKPVRYYPCDKLASHVLGYLNEIDTWRLMKLQEYGYKVKDIVGYGGIEEKFDYYLRQTEGALSVEVDYRSRFTRVLGFKSSEDGEDIQLSIDINIQKIAENSLAGIKGSVILMDPYSGEIIAMASSPDFSPSAFTEGPSSYMSQLKDSSLLNRSISGLYPSASVFKLVSACAGLESGKINPSTTYFCPGSMGIGNRNFKCWSTHKEENLADAIAHSCDVYFYKLGLMLGPQTIHDYALKFGLSKLTGVDLPYEASGVIPDPLWKRMHNFQSWYDGDTANFVIGQGYVLVTPIQIVRLMAVFANGGMLVRPYIVKSVGGKDISKYQKSISRISIKEDVINQVRQDLRRVVSASDGTAHTLSNLVVTVAGKTGTAEFSRGLTHGWFAGFFPYKKPKFVICVFIEDNGSGHMATALSKRIIEEMVKQNLIETL